MTINQKSKKAYSRMLMIWILGLIILAVFLIWRFWAKDWLAHRKATEMENKLPVGIEVIARGDKKIVRNAAEGYEVTVPKEWEIDATKTQFYSSLDPVEGCKIESSVSSKISTIEELQQDTKEELEWYTVKKNEYSIIDVAGYKAVKNIFESAEMGYSMSIYIPTDKRLYGFVIYIPPQNTEKCTQYMEDFLKTVSIK